ncbi:MAG: dCTP deaminase, partial [Candidatus Woesearchaeota archaeon]
SSGRTFADVRAFADKNRAIDLIHPLYSQEKVKIWVMITPRIFNIQVGPGLSFNQLRFFVGQDPKLSQSEISQLHEKEAIAYDYNDGKPKKLPTIFNHADGLLTTLSLQSRDGRNKLKDLKVKPGDCFLLFTREILHFPAEFSGEMKAYSMAALRGPLHFAGFFDNGFYGDAVIELLSEETEEIYLTHGMPIAEFEFYRTSGKPDKIYGDKKSGSNYYGQVGPRMAKYFKQEDMSGIVALKARKVPYPLDLRKKHFYHMRDFFEVY